MKLLKVFIIAVVIFGLSSCQREISLNEKMAIEHYGNLKDYYSEYLTVRGMEVVRQYLLNELKKSDGVVSKLPFERVSGEETGSNIICRFYPQMSRRILFITSYIPLGIPDTADYEKETLRASFNTAFMLELARILSVKEPSQFGVDLIFTDVRISNAGEHEPALDVFGEESTLYGAELGIYLRLQGASGMSIFIDDHSYRQLPYLVYRVWKRARLSGWKEFEHELRQFPLLEGEELLFNKFHAIKLYNEASGIKTETEEILTANFRMIGSLFAELIYEKD